MATKGSYGMVRVLKQAGRERRIALQYSARITGRWYTDEATLQQCCMNLLEGVVSHYAARTWDKNLSLISVSASPDLMSQSMFDAAYRQVILRTTVVISASGALGTFVPKPARRSTLVLPSQIDFAGSTVTINRTLGLTYSGLNSCSGVEWRKLPRTNWLDHQASLTLPLGAVLRGDLITLCGNLNT